VAVSRGPNVGSGAKDTPLHVVVEETIGGQIFKWVKFFLYFGLFTYLSLIVVAMVIETFQTFRKVGGKAENEPSGTSDGSLLGCSWMRRGKGGTARAG